MGRGRSSTRDDFDKVKDSLQKLKAENRHLRKENASLKKQLGRAEVTAFETVDAREYELIVEPDDGTECPECTVHSILQEIKAGRYTIKRCKVCGYKKRTDSLKKT